MAKKLDTRSATQTEQRSESSGSCTTDTASGEVLTIGVSKTTSIPGSRPVRTFRLRGVKVAVFENKSEQGAFYKTSLQKIYREGEEWKTTTSLGRDDLPVARLLLQRAWEFILETEAAARTNDQGE